MKIISFYIIFYINILSKYVNTILDLKSYNVFCKIIWNIYV